MPVETLEKNQLKIGRVTLTSRLIVGTGKYKTLDIMKACLEASGASMVTVAIRRVNLQDRSEAAFLTYLPKHMVILPNTAGCYNLQDTLRTARLARELLEADSLNWKFSAIHKRFFQTPKYYCRPQKFWFKKASRFCRTPTTIRLWRASWLSWARPQSCRWRRRSVPVWEL